MNTPPTLQIAKPIRVLVAADGDAATRLVHAMTGSYVDVVGTVAMDGPVVAEIERLDPDVLVMAAGSEMEHARTIATQVAAKASRMTVMIVDAPELESGRVFWPKDRLHRTTTSPEPLQVPTVGLLACA
jgi:AmiR/NasT family two-component response regulator